MLNNDPSPRPRGLLSYLVLLLFLLSCHGGDDGRPIAPLSTIPVGVPLSDIVPFSGFNAYTVSVIPGSIYKISMTAVSDDADLLFFGTDSTFTALAQCSIDNTAINGISPEDCVVVASGNTLHFGVDGAFLFTSSAVYTIAVEQLVITDLNLSLPVLDSTTQQGARVYAVPVTAGSIYTAAITGLDNDADLYVFNNDILTSPNSCTIDNTQFTLTTPEDCTLTAAGGTLYFIVDGIFSTAPNVQYTALVTPAPVVPTPMNEGLQNSPLLISIGTPTTGQVASAPTGTSYYAVNGLTSGSLYTISIMGMTNDADLTVYNDGSFTTPATCSIDNTSFLGTTAESCTLTASGPSLFFTVTAFTSTGGVAFTSLVEPGP